jgi:MarR family 2-MHQ and catechol resistance regulon transcriptional repressor
MDNSRAIFEELGFAMEDVQLPEGAIVYALARTYSLVTRKLAKMYKPFGLSVASFNLLVLLQRGKDPESLTQYAIGERLAVSPSDMTGLIDRLGKKGLVRRLPGKDRRCNLVRITPKGSKLVDEVWPSHAGEIKRLAKAFNQHEAQVVARAMSRVRQLIQA